MTELQKILKKHNACSAAIEWAKPYATLAEAWAVCERGDWMLWVAVKAELCTRQELVLAACQCARLALPHATSPSVIEAIETEEAWARGEATIEQVRAAADAAAYAADAAANAAYATRSATRSAAHSAAYAAAYAAVCAAADAADAAVRAAADAAANAAYAAAYAAHSAAYAAAYAAADAAYAAVRTDTLRQCADIVRNLYKGYK